jgi:hypothetical protein
MHHNDPIEASVDCGRNLLMTGHHPCTVSNSDGRQPPPTAGPVVALLVALGACGGAQRTTGPEVALRDGCDAGQRWDGRGCIDRGDGTATIAKGKDALGKFQVDAALVALDAAARTGPLAYRDNVTLWEQRGIAEAYLEHADRAAAAFDMLLALDPGHLLSYTLSPKATFVFERSRAAASARGAPTIDVSWPRGLQVGAPVPVEIEVVADPRGFLARASLFVRRRGEAAWRATDLDLPARGGFRRVILPAVDERKPASLEVYLRAYDHDGNEVLAWADADRPREIPLAYTPPAPWWKRWWIWATAGSVLAIGTGGVVYGATRSPPDRIGGQVNVP